MHAVMVEAVEAAGGTVVPIDPTGCRVRRDGIEELGAEPVGNLPAEASAACAASASLSAVSLPGGKEGNANGVSEPRTLCERAFRGCTEGRTR